jgi:FixJ family two-component response regulator
MRVAIVEDDRSVRRALRRLLRSANLAAETFASVREFLAALKRNTTRPDCVLVDLKMPGLGALDLLRALAERRASVPVIVMSAFDTPKTRSDCETLGAAAFLSKPFEEKGLFSAISGAVNSRFSRKEKSNAMQSVDQGPMGAI